jgi:hypothetical protein
VSEWIETLPADRLLEIIAQAGNDISVAFAQTGPMAWQGEAKCKHGRVQNATYQIMPGVPPLNHAAMVTHVRTMHQQIFACDCPHEAPRLNATVTFEPATAIQPGELRIIRELSGTIEPPKKNFYYGGRLMCARIGAYQVDASVQLARTVATGGGGIAHVLVMGVAVASAPLKDESGKAIATFAGMGNLQANQPVVVAYENTTSIEQGVTATTLKVSEVWVP